MSFKETDRLLSRLEVADHFGIPKRFLELAASRGEGPKYYKIGRLVRYRVEDVRAWIQSCAVDAGK